MIDFITGLYTDLVAFTKTAPVFGGAVMIWLLGVASYFGRNIPNKIADFLKTSYTSELDITNTGSWLNEVNYDLFLTWFFKQKHTFRARSFSLNSTWTWEGYQTLITAGLGLHVFIYKGRIFWFKRNRIENSVSDKFKESLTITGLTRDITLFYDMIEEFKRDHKKSGNQVYKFGSEGWDEGRPLHKRSMESVAIKRTIKEAILKEIKLFKQNESWYGLRGIPYKLVFLIYGPSGTGKTSLIRAIASEIMNDIYELPSSEMNDRSLPKALGKLTSNSILLVEDFEGHSSLKQREKALRSTTILNNVKDATPNADITETAKKENDSLMVTLEPLTLSGFLNSLDGIAPLHNCIVFLTSNDVADLDDSVLRSGRIDSKYYIGLSDDETIKEYVDVVKGDYIVDFSKVTFKPILGCDLIDLYRRVSFSIPDFIQAIPLESGSVSVQHKSIVTTGNIQHVCDWTSESLNNPSHCRICGTKASGSCQ